MKAYRFIGASGIQIIQSEPNAATIEDFFVDPDDRNKHIGTRLMRATCRDADRENVRLWLTPHPFGMYDIDTETYFPPGLTYKQLCAFYRSFGFRFKPKPYENTMMRTPKEL